MIWTRGGNTYVRAGRCAFRITTEGVTSERVLADTGEIWDSVYEVPLDHRWLACDNRPLFVFALLSRVDTFQSLRDHVENVLGRIEPVCDVLRAYREGGALTDFNIRSYSTEAIRTLELSADELRRIALVSDTLEIHALSLDENAIPQNG